MTMDEVVARATADRRRGAGEIEADVIRGLLADGGPWPAERLEGWGAALVAAHPVMANLRRLAVEMRQGGELRRFLEGRLQRIQELPQLFTRHGAHLVLENHRVVTVSRSSAVVAVLLGARAAGWTGDVVVLDGTASGGGPEHAAWLMKHGLRVRSLPDGAAAHVLGDRRQRVVVMVGADAIGPRRVVNATGTRTLVDVAAMAAIPRVVVADTGKDLPEHEVDALMERVRICDEGGLGRSWPVFEATPRERFTHRVSEHAVEGLG